MTEPQELTYARGELSVGQIEQEIERFWADLKTDEKLRVELATKGLEPDVLRDTEPSGAIPVIVCSSGFDPVSVPLIIVFAPTANRVLKDLWTTVLLPRIRRRWGDDAIGEETQGRKR